MSVRNVSKRIFVITGLCFSLFLLSNCEVGLGNSVDTQPPSGTITSPAKGAVIRDAFVMQGTARDETYVDSVTVVLKSTASAVSFAYSAEVDKKAQTWSAKINKKLSDGTFEIPDGEYGVTVTVKDSAGRTSTIESLYKIDNTPPVVVIKRPGVDDTFGRTIKVTGDISDENTLEKLVFTVYRKNPSGTLEQAAEPLVFTNISGVGLELTVGKYFDSPDAAGYDETLSEIYNAFYDAEIGGTQDLYCTVQVSDSAVAYPIAGNVSGLSSEAGSGNLSTVYYLYDDIYSAIYSSSGKGLSNSDLVKIFNGTYADTAVAEEVKSILQQNEKSVPAGSAVPDPDNISKFTLNPENSPVYEVSGYKIEEGVWSGITNESKFTFSVTPGRDQINLKPDTIRVYVQQYQDGQPSGEPVVLMESTEQIESLKADGKTEEAAAAESRRAGVDITASSGERFQATVPIGKLPVGKTHRIVVEGSDLEENEVAPSDSAGYGFTVQSNNKPPELTVDDASTADLKVQNHVDFTYSGTIRSESDNVDLVLTVSAKDQKGSGEALQPVTIPVTPEPAAGTAGDWTWRGTVDAGSLGNWNNPSNALYLYEVTISAGNAEGDGGNRTEVTRRVYVDTEAPVPVITAVTPQVATGEGNTKRENNVNGVITVTGNASDNREVAATQLELSLSEQETGTWTPLTAEQENCITTITNTGMSFEYTVNTALLTDKRWLKLTVTTTDTAGNTGATEKIVYIDQSTDLPAFTFSNVKAGGGDSTVTAKDNLFGMGSWTLYGTATDDDGVQRITAVLDKDSNKPYEIFSVAGSTGSTTSKSFEYPVDKTLSGDHELKLTVTDINGKFVTVTVPFAVDNAAPVITITGPDVSSGFAAQSVKIQGTSSDDSGIALVELVSLTKTTTGSDGKPETVDITPQDTQPEQTEKTVTVTAEDGQGTVTKTVKTWDIWTYDAAMESVDTTATYTWTFKGVDIYGRETETSISYKVDNVPPAFGSALKFSGYGKDDYPGTETGGSGLVPVWLNTAVQTISGTVTETNPDVISYTVTGTGSPAVVSEGTVSAAAGENKPFKVTVEFEEGENTVSFTTTDLAGNHAAELRRLVYIDTTPPSVTAAGYDAAGNNAGVLTNEETVTVVFTADDTYTGTGGTDVQGSGIVSAAAGRTAGFKDTDALLLAGGGSLSGSGTDGDPYRLPVHIKSLGDGTHTLYLRVTDKAGNSTETALPELTVDRTAPVVTYTAPAANSTVNKTITLTGSVSDSNPADGWTPVVYVKKPDGTASGGFRWMPAVRSGAGTDSVEMPELSLTAQDTEWTVSGFDTTVLDTAYDVDTGTEGTQIELQIRFTDKAGNSTPDTGTTLKLTVDQNADRPVITLNTVNPDGSTVLRSSVLTGSVSDDDGTVNKLYIQVVKEGGTFADTDAAWKMLDDPSNWTYTIPGTSGSPDGTYTVWFKVTDAAGETFVSSEDSGTGSSLTRPYVKYISGTDKTDGVPFRFSVDTNPPVVTSLMVSVNGGDFTEVTNNMVLGGSSSSVKFRAIASDTVTANDALIVTLKNLMGDPKTLEYTGDDNNVAGTKNGIFESETIKIGQSSGTPSGTPSGTYTLIVEAQDAAGMPGQLSRLVIIDNTPPETVTGVSPAPDVEVTGEVTLTGLVSDDEAGNSGVASVQYAVPPETITDPKDAEITWHDADSFQTVSWSITLSNLGDYVGDTAKDEFRDGYSGYETSQGSGLYQLPVWFKVTDKAGNTGYITGTSIRYNPNADKPRVTVTYPVHNVTDSTNQNFSYVVMGGTVRINGSAEDNEGIDSVWLQFDMDGDGKFGDKDDPFMSESYVTLDIPCLTGQKGVKATGTVSWSYALDVSGLSGLNYGEDKKTLNVRVVAVDNDTTGGQLAGAWSEILHISVNNGVPQFGASDPLKLKQFAADGTVVAEQVYTADMYIQGSGWYLTGSIEDSDGISAISVTGSASGTLDTPDWFTSHPTTADTDGDQWYDMKIPVGGDSGKWTISITATDKDASGAKESSVAVSVNVDNTPPAFELDGAAGTGSLILYRDTYGTSGTRLSQDNPVQNSNGYFTAAGKITEDGSGFSRLVFYFLRDGTGGKRVYNPMESHGDDRIANRTNIADTKTDGSVYINGDGLPVLYLEKAGRGTADSGTATDSLSHSLISGNANIRKGGLVKIGGMYRLISAVSGNTVTFTPACDTSFTQAELVYGMVVDNTGESQNSDGSVKNDDGDGMVESYRKSGSDYYWDASVNSKNIPDGPVALHCVAFDVAGNSSHAWVETKVSNNRPRITSVKLGTDLNGNDSCDDNEYDTFYVSLNDDGTGNTSYGTDIWTLDTAKWKDVDGTTYWTAKKELWVIPEFVGGTAPYTWVYSKSAGSSSGGLTKPEAAGNDKKSGALDAGGSSLYLTNDDLGTAGEDSVNTYRFSFWDSTEETVPGTDSQWTILNVLFRQDLTDDVTPQAWINPFYWNGPDDNSLAGNSSAKGHIELEADLPGTGFKDNSGVYDRDPKVSGEIVVRGGASDDKMLKSLTVEFAEFTATAEFDGTSWMLPSAGNNGWTLSVTDEGVTQTGHQVTWEFTVDTSRISGVAGADKAVTVSVTDAGPNTGGGSNSSDSSTTQTTADKPTPYYRLDVVPYITGVKTALSDRKKNNPSVYARTVLGRYPVNEGETVTLTGFNLGNSSVTPAVTGVTSGITVQSDVTVPVKDLSSGQLELTVNSVPALNNRNNNDARGSYEYAGTVEFNTSAASLAGFYNRQPNGDNNNLLTDDVYLDVWQFNSKAAIPVSDSIEQPVMKINPKSGLIGFAFTNGPLYFSMPGTTDSYAGGSSLGGKREYSYVYWQGSYDFMTSIALAYDSEGHTYGTAAGGDINSTDADRYSFMTDRWGTSGSATKGSYEGKNALRLEAIGQYGYADGTEQDTLRFKKQRIQSPVLVTSRTGSSTNIYLAYYDQMNDEIRFRYGNLPDTTTSKANFGNFNDSYRNNTMSADANLNNGKYTTEYVNIIAGGTTNRKAGKYVGMGVVQDGDKDIVVLCWYDSEDYSLKYTYNTNPTSGTTGADVTNWSEPITLFEEAGEYCKLVVDNDGGVHIAAYDVTENNVVYAYLESYKDTAPSTCIVDSYGNVGEYLTIDVAKDAGKWVPYIAYQGVYTPMLAYLNAAFTGSSENAGATDDMYTGAWEISPVPTPNRTSVLDDNVNVGVWKDDLGQIKNSVPGTSSADQYYGVCYGNGTSNPVLGYAIETGSGGSIETAQKK